MPIDRFTIAAAVDRTIYGSETVFDPADASALLKALPHRKTAGWQFGIAGRLPGGSASGYAAGIGDTKIEDGKDRTFEYRTGADDWCRAGQWKPMWVGKRGMQYVEIGQVMADFDEEGHGARIRYTRDGTPVAMDIRVVRDFSVLNLTLAFPGWREWKLPAEPG
jgi:hypothetical protein